MYCILVYIHKELHYTVSHNYNGFVLFFLRCSSECRHSFTYSKHSLKTITLPLSCPLCTRGLGTGGDACSFVGLILLVPNEQGHPPSLPLRGPGGGRGRGEECDSRGQSD